MSDIKVDSLTGKTTDGDITITDASTTSTLQSGLNKMWIAFDGGAATVFASFNISSTTDNGVGDYIYHYSNNFNAIEEYSSAMSVSLSSSVNAGSYVTDGTASTNSIRVYPARTTGGTHVDMGYTTMNCCGDLA